MPVASCKYLVLLHTWTWSAWRPWPLQIRMSPSGANVQYPASARPRELTHDGTSSAQSRETQTRDRADRALHAAHMWHRKAAAACARVARARPARARTHKHTHLSCTCMWRFERTAFWLPRWEWNLRVGVAAALGRSVCHHAQVCRYARDGSARATVLAAALPAWARRLPFLHFRRTSLLPILVR